MNLRIPEHMSASDYQALIATVMGVPEARPAASRIVVGSSKLTREQRVQWYDLVVKRGVDVNLALQIVRGLL